jgi:hypothetical protein
MRPILSILLGVAVATPAIAQTSHEVRGYTRKDGTYVAPHYQTNPDNSRLNNWSTRGNTNPYTGKPGTIDPYARANPSTAPYGSSPTTGTSSSGEDPQ